MVFLLRFRARLFKSTLFILVLVAIVSTVCVSCSRDNTALDYFPFVSNACYKYVGQGNPAANQDIYIDYSHEENNRWQRRVVAAGRSGGECFEYVDGELKVIYSEMPMDYIYDVTDKTDEDSIIVLKEPLKKGSKWKRTSAQVFISSEPGSKPEIVEVMAEVTGEGIRVETPYKTFENAIEITETYGDSEQVIKEYYVSGIGQVKTIAHTQSIVLENNELTSLEYVDISIELSEIIQNSPYESERFFFYPDPNDDPDTTPYEKRVVSHATNDEDKKAFNIGIAGYSDAAMKAYLDGVELNSILVVSGRVKADFNARLTENARGLSADEENALLRALVNTLAYFYSSAKICVTVGGNPYTSENIQQGVDEYMSYSVSMEVTQ